MTDLPTFAGFFKLAIIAQFADGAGSRAKTDASYKASVPRSDEKFIAPGFGAMAVDGEQNLFVRLSAGREIFVPCPSQPFFSGGFEPRFLFAAFNARNKFGAVVGGRAAESDTLTAMLAQPRIENRVNDSRRDRLFDSVGVQRDGFTKIKQVVVRFHRPVLAR